ncbi:16S rRNA (cytidine(1402)-2'-O)-methyltransferase [Acidithiobacillus sp. AMEEHan]|uniref:16S rRNA (cytidine(1402)-2'-O)-methyltransferase n=1 Tax=Acidithiobacillus sp. AMEEHan TaxID=2994951 RepID=UPI0027E4AF10|nr:16S rRNA (cytidine(1402)-2'-O)-methyltransferase [Acidithiobacillus sp. AMEEHan]
MRNEMRETPTGREHYPGRLDIVGTPIGNLEDLSPRARRALAEADRILVEDRRHAQRLFQSIGIQPRSEPLHEHNERRQIPRILAYLQAGERLALISDAGMPLISDPGYPLVRELRRAGVAISVIPGPSAALAALALAGLPTDRFCFEGFLPAKSAARQQRLRELEAETRSMIFYEAPHRILATLEDMIAVLSGERGAILARELTKLHEETLGESLEAIRATLSASPERQRGEMCLVLAGAPERESGEAELDRLLRPLLQELPLAQAVRLAEAQSGAAHRRLYQRALALTSAAESD